MAGGEGRVQEQLIAGAFAGAISDAVTHPLSTVKTRLQCQGAMRATSSSALYNGPIMAFASIIRTEGFLSLYKGIGIVLSAAAPAQALYFVGYETAKSLGGGSPLGNFIAGMNAQICGSLAWVPMDVVKERLQIEGQIKTSEKFGGSLNALRKIVEAEGVRGLYRAYWMHQLTWAPFNGVYFACYEETKQALARRKVLEDGVAMNVCSGVVAGVVASVSTSPIDLVKTRLQVQRSNPEIFDYKGPVDALRKIVRQEGVMALFDGVGARVLWLTPRLSLAVTVYDYAMKRMAENKTS